MEAKVHYRAHKSLQIPKPWEKFRNNLVFHCEVLLAPHSTSEAEDRFLSAARNSLFDGRTQPY